MQPSDTLSTTGRTKNSGELIYGLSLDQIKKLKTDYEAALADATNSIPYAIDFLRLFQKTICSFSYYTGVVGPSTLNMQSDLYDRYDLTVQIPVTFDDTRRKVVSFGSPQFTLLEISQVGRNAVSFNPASSGMFWGFFIG